MRNEMKCITPDKCRITASGPSTTTLAYYPPVLDGHGNNLNPDMNTTTRCVKCATCGKEWSESWRNGEKIEVDYVPCYSKSLQELLK